MVNEFINGWILGLIFTAALLFIGLYVYGSLALMTIARRTNTENAWLAWIPIANIYLMMRIGKLPTWTLALWALIFVPMIGGLCASGMSIWYWWAIAEQRGKEGWWGLLMIVPILNLVLLGILAWGKDEDKITPIKKKVVKKKVAKKKVTKKKK